MNLSFASLAMFCVPNPALRFPDHDALDVPHGHDYKDVFVRIHKRRVASAGRTNDLRGGLPYTFVGNDISALDMLLKVHPFVGEVRCNYPIVLPRTSTRRGVVKAPMIVLADRMLSVVLKSAPNRWHLHAIFLDQRRLNSARPFLSTLGNVSAETVSTDALNDQQIENAAQCYQWLLGLDVREWRGAAEWFANCLLLSYPRAKQRAITLDAFIRELTTQLHLKFNDGYCLLGAAIVYRFIELDHSQALSIHRPLGLIERSIA